MLNSSEISVIVQGPVEDILTFKCLNSIRSVLPYSEIILSTWKGSNTANLSFDILVESDDPGAFFCDKKQKTKYNVNRQIVSTQKGLLQATKPYSIKTRSDIFFLNSNFLNFYKKFLKRCPEWHILEERVLICTIYSRNPCLGYPMPFHPSDWFFFGKTNDLLNIWDIPLASEPETSNWFKNHPRPQFHFHHDLYNRYTPEQYIWISFLRKNTDKEIRFMHLSDLSESAIKESEISIANNLVLLEPSKLGIKFMKYGLSPSDYLTLYNHFEWLQLYKKYCFPKQSKSLISSIFNFYLKQIRYWKFFISLFEITLKTIIDQILLYKIKIVHPHIFFYSLNFIFKEFMSHLLVGWQIICPKTYKHIRNIFRKLINNSEGEFFSP